MVVEMMDVEKWVVSDAEVEEGGDEWRFIGVWNIMKKGKKK